MYKVKNNSNQVFQLIDGLKLKAYETIYVNELTEQLNKLQDLKLVTISKV